MSGMFHTALLQIKISPCQEMMAYILAEGDHGGTKAHIQHLRGDLQP